jgi:hypothetical protein
VKRRAESTGAVARMQGVYRTPREARGSRRRSRARPAPSQSTRSQNRAGAERHAKATKPA